MKGAYNFVPGVMGMILMLICAMMTSISIAREKEMGTMEILLVSPVKPAMLIIAKTVPYFFISLINLTTILLLSIFILGVPVAGSLFWLLVLSLVYIFVNLSLGLVISSAVNNQQTALLISGMVLMLPVIMLSGMMFPVENMPVFFQWLSQIIPAKWYIIGVKKIMIKGLGFSAIVPQLTVLLGMAILLIAVSIKKFKYRLE
jgi:ABC-2 type transport system permease protein